MRTSTPPSRAISGKTWPGVAMSEGPLLGSMATDTVRARSDAEMPVVTPSRASMETVKAVSWRDSFLRAIIGRPSCSMRSRVMARQIRPRPYLAMKLMASGPAICAGTTRSPSFSRSSSSTRMNMRPLRASSMISSIGETSSLKLTRQGSCCVRDIGLRLLGPGEKARNVARQHVYFQVDPVTAAVAAEGGHRGGVRDDVHPEAPVIDLVHRQGNAIQRDRALRSEKAQDLGVRSEEHTSELQSRGHLVCRLLLEKKKSTLREIEL